MNRLLFAAARGARIQRTPSRYTNIWEDSHLLWVRKPRYRDYDYRIHPEDAHLQYGPISTELRIIAENAATIPEDSLSAELAEICISHLKDLWLFFGVDDVDAAKHRSLFCLILSEYLSDLGM